jgi:transposase
MDDATLAALPDDPAALKTIILSFAKERDAAAHERDAATRAIDVLRDQNQNLELEKLHLKHKLLAALKRIYGPRADRVMSEPDLAQLLLDFAKELESRPVDTTDIPPDADLRGVDEKSIRRVRRRRGRRDLSADGFDHLPVLRKEHDLPDDQKSCPCCAQPREQIGTETSWQIEYIPGSFTRVEHIRLKYACKHCGEGCDHCDGKANIELAQRPAAPIEKGMAGPGLLAYIVTSKFADYLPLYRLENIFARSGFEIDRVTQCIWCRDVAEIAMPLYNRMKQRVLAGHVIHTDDTTMPMLQPGAGKTKQARMWVYAGDEDNPYNIFDFTISRSRDGPAKFLAEYGSTSSPPGKQTIVADAYGGYDGVVVAAGITRAGCWAHARRKFVDVQDLSPAIAKEALALIGKLFTIEQQAKEMNTVDRLSVRQVQSKPIVTELHHRLLAWKQSLLPRHPTTQAINYVLNQWQELNQFLADGAVPIDNNLAEREMKRIAINRKNSLFVGNQRGGQTAAVLATLTSTCRRHGIDPQLYLTQLLTNLPSTPISQLDNWLPNHWLKLHPRHDKTTAMA